MYKAFLIKYAEIAIKGKNRYLFEDALVSQMNHALKKVDGTFRIRKEQGRIYIEMDGEYDYDEAVEALKCVFGIVGICPVVILEDEGFDKLAEEVIHHIDEAYPDKHFTFKVNARRARKNYPLESMEINAQLGERILNAFPETRVDVHKPEVVINVEIRNQINVYSTVIPGPGGMPVGTNGKAMLLLSGGIDSTTCLAQAVQVCGAENVTALCVFYGQKHSREMAAARKVAAYYGVRLLEQDIAGIMSYSNCSLLAASSEAIEHKSYAQQLAEHGEGTVATYVPFRNGLLISAAAAIAISLGADAICYGAHADDAAGRAYPDCTPEFYAAMDTAIYEGSGKLCHLEAPLLNKNKAQIVELGLNLGAPYQYTWSCYEGGDRPCGECGTCIDRANAFKANGVDDPAL